MIKEEAIRLPFNYATGAAAAAYLGGLDEGRLLASRCEPCAKVLSPARSLCPFCGYPTAAELVEVGPSGVVESWTRLPDGGDFVLVRLDGADTALLHRFVGARTADASAGGDTSPPGDGPASAAINPAVGDGVVAVFDSTGLRGFEVVHP